MDKGKLDIRDPLVYDRMLYKTTYLIDILRYVNACAADFI